MNVLICGRWDGCHLWLQWDDVNPDAGYLVRIRLRLPKPGAVWGEWVPIQFTRKIVVNWLAWSVMREGWEVQAQVAVAAPEVLEEAWVTAREVEFQKSRCRFRISTTRRPVQYAAGSQFFSIVDGGGCGYALGEDVDLRPGEHVEVEMTAADLSGYCQLDYAGHFVYRPSLGLCIENIEPSVDDVIETGRDHASLVALKRTTPLRLVFGNRNAFNGNA